MADRPELLVKIGVMHPGRRNIVPVIFALGNPRQPVVDGVPVVSVSKLVSFLYGISPVDERFRSFPVKNSGTATLFREQPKP